MGQGAGVRRGNGIGGQYGGELETGIGLGDSGGGSSDADDGGGEWSSFSGSGGGFCPRSGESALGLFELWKRCVCCCEGGESVNSRDRGGVQNSESHS